MISPLVPPSLSSSFSSLLFSSVVLFWCSNKAAYTCSNSVRNYLVSFFLFLSSSNHNSLRIGFFSEQIESHRQEKEKRDRTSSSNIASIKYDRKRGGERERQRERIKKSKEKKKRGFSFFSEHHHQSRSLNHIYTRMKKKRRSCHTQQ